MKILQFQTLMNNQSNMSFLAPPNTSIVQRSSTLVQGKRANGVNTSYVSSGYNSAFQSKQRPSKIFGGAASKNDSTQNPQQQPIRPIYSPFIQKRNLADISSGGHHQQFYTPLKNLSEQQQVYGRTNERQDDDSTIKPDFRVNTVMRTHQNRSIRQQINQSKLQQRQSVAAFDIHNEKFGLKHNMKKSPEFGTAFRAEQIVDDQSQQFYTPLPGGPILSTFETSEQIVKDMSVHDRQKAIATVQNIVEDIALKNSNILCNDLARQFDNSDDAVAVTGLQGIAQSGNKYEFEPIMFQASSQSSIPDEILSETIKCQQEGRTVLQGMLVESIVFFACHKKLFLWNTGKTRAGVHIHGQRQRGLRVSKDQSEWTMREFKTPIQQVCFIENYQKNFRPFICVATTTEIQLIGFKPNDADSIKQLQLSISRQQFDLTKLADSGYNSVPLDTLGEIIEKIVQFKKTGRIFYTSRLSDYSQPQIKELQLDAKDEGLGRIFSLFAGSQANKKLKAVSSVDINESSASRMVKQIIPNFLNVFASYKVFSDIKIDEQRNVMYVLSHQVIDKINKTLGPGCIDIYDLGIHGDTFAKVLSISQAEMAKVIQQNIGVYLPPGAKHSYSLIAQYQIASIHPISCSESLQRQLLVVTENCLRIYIQIDEKDVKIQKGSSEIITKIESKNIQFDYQQTQRPDFYWQIASVQSMPYEEEVNSVYYTNPHPFKINVLNKQRPQSDTFGTGSIYNNDMSCLIYSTHCNTSDFQICMVSKNESAFSFLREQTGDLGGKLPMNFEMRESYSAVQMFGAIREQKNEFDERVNNIQEKVIDVQCLNRWQELSEDVHVNLQRMLGYNKALLLDQGWGLTNQHQYLPLSVFEKSVYEQHSVVRVLTNKRCVNLVQLRPIDQLVTILKNIVHAPSDRDILEDFEDFVTKYSLQETCNMLLQIVVEFKDAYYLECNLVDKAIHSSHRVKQREAAIKSQVQSYQHQPRQNQINRFGASSSARSMSPFTVGTKSRQLQFRTQYFEDQGDPAGLYPFIIEDNKTINTNVHISKIENPAISQIALDLLLIYGDSVRLANLSLFNDFLLSQNQRHQIGVLKQENLSIRMNALFTHIQRILRPIWETNMTYRPNFNKVDKQISNIEMFLPALAKLRNFMSVIEAEQSQFSRRTSVEEQAALLWQEPISQNRGIRNQGVLSQAEFCHLLDSSSKDRLETVERKALKQLIVFTRRCIDVIEFMKIISFEGNQTNFAKMLANLNKEDTNKKKKSTSNSDTRILSEIADTCFRDMVIDGGCENDDLELSNLNITLTPKKGAFMKKLFEASVLLSNQLAQGDKSRHFVNVSQVIEQKALYIQRLCPTLFSSSTTQTFIGESLLYQALKEKDPAKKQQLLNEGIDQLIDKPQLLNLKQVVPILCKMDSFRIIVDLCMRKIKYLQGIKFIPREENQQDPDHSKAIIQCYDVILQMFSALDQNIVESKDKINDFSSKVEEALQTNKHKNKGFYGLFFNHFTNEIPTVTIAQKVGLRKNILEIVHQFQDRLLVKQLFEYMVSQPAESINTFELPTLDAQSFEDVCEELLFNQNQVTKSCLDALIKLMLDSNRYGTLMKPRLCEIVLKLCEDNEFGIYKLKTEEHGQRNQTQEAVHIPLTCEEKITYCQLALDNLEDAASTQYPMTDRDSCTRYIAKLHGNIDHYRFQIGIISALQERAEWLQTVKSQLTDEQKTEIQTIVDRRATLEVSKFSIDQIEAAFIDELNLFEEKYKLLKNEFEKATQYDDGAHNSLDIQQILSKFLYTFELQFKELVQLDRSNCFKAMLLLGMYCTKTEVLLKAINIMWKQQLKNAQEDINNLTTMVKELIDGKMIYNCEGFSLLGHVYTAIASGRALQPLVGSDVNNVFIQNLRGATNDKVALICCLVSLYLWTNTNILSFQQRISTENATFTILPRAFEKKQASQEFTKDLKLNFDLIKKQVNSIQRHIAENELVWPKQFEVVISQFKNLIDDQLIKLEETLSSKKKAQQQ